ncbi:hypothetical protein QZH41_003918 [Actinostola sp. cb2023]|nr:hypothetical protein QZH41_003918 [Actinostola sp. cb2023]
MEMFLHETPFSGRMAVASFNFLSFNMESLRVAYHKAYKVKDLALCKLLEENFNFTGRLLAKVHKLKVGAISQRLDQPLHPKFTALDDMRRLTFSSLAPPETSMADVEIQTDENPPLIRFKTSCSQSTQCDPILPVPFSEPAYVSMQDRETQTTCKIKVIEVGDQVATSSGSIAGKTRTMIPLEPNIIVIIVIEPPPQGENNVECAVIDTPGPERTMTPLQPNIIVIGPPPESEINVDSVVLETPEPDADDLGTVTTRSKRVCPVCGKLRSQLARHLKTFHDWSSNKYRIFSLGGDNTKTKNPLRKCPVSKCGFRSVRFDRHIPSVHKIRRGSEKYKTLMNKLHSTSLVQKHLSVGPESTRKRTMIVSDNDDSDFDNNENAPKKQCNESVTCESDVDMVDEDVDEFNVECAEEEEEELAAPNESSLGFTDSEFGQSMADFKTHLMLPDGGKKTEVQANIVTRQVSKLAICMSEGKEPNSMSGPWMDKERVWKTFFEPNLSEYNSSHETGREKAIQKGLSPSTLQCYSAAMEEYCNFLTSNNKWTTKFNDKERNALSCIAKCQKKWRLSLRKDRRVQMNRRFVQDKQTQLTLDDINKVLKSEVPVIEKANCRQLQAFLITKLVVENAGRSSLLSNFTLKAADEMTPDDGLYTAFITDHKTAASKGTAFLQMRRSGYRYLKAYQHALRPIIEAPKSGSHFCLNSAGTPITSSMVSGNVQAFVVEANVLPRDKACPTDLRKMWVTSVYADGTEAERRQLSSKMAHSPRTAQIWYDLTEKKTEASAGFVLMEKRLEHASGEAGAQEESPVKSTAMKTKRKKKSWTKEDEVAIVAGFLDDIKSPERPKLAEILAKFEKNLPAIYNRENSKKYRERCFDKVNKDGSVIVTFENQECVEWILAQGTITINGYPVVITSTDARTKYVKVYYLAYEVANKELLAVLGEYGHVYNIRRDVMANHELIETGVRTVTMAISKPVPSYLKVGASQVKIYYSGQPQTCRKCGGVGHFARDCLDVQCFRCRQPGHVSRNCVEELKCNQCGEYGHTGWTCNAAFAFKMPEYTAAVPQVVAPVMNTEKPAADVSTFLFGTQSRENGTQELFSQTSDSALDKDKTQDTTQEPITKESGSGQDKSDEARQNLLEVSSVEL